MNYINEMLRGGVYLKFGKWRGLKLSVEGEMRKEG